MLMLDYRYFSMCIPKENSEPKKRYDRGKPNDSHHQVTPEKIHSELKHCEQITNNEEIVEQQALNTKAASTLRNQLLKFELQHQTRRLKETKTKDRKLVIMTSVISLSVILIFVIAVLMSAAKIEIIRNLASAVRTAFFL